MQELIIAVDFDGTCVTHEFPKVVQDIGAAPVLRALVASGHKLILWTMRSDKERVEVTTDSVPYNIEKAPSNYLTDAVNWFKDNDIELWGINENPDQKTWTESPKAFASMYIDDLALGAPLRMAGDVEKPFIDWAKVGEFFAKSGIITVEVD